MTKYGFYKALNACRNPAKTGLVRAKLEALPIETRRHMINWLLSNNGPVLTCLLCAQLQREFEPVFGGYGYWHHKGDFIYSESNWVRHPMRNGGRAFDKQEERKVMPTGLTTGDYAARVIEVWTKIQTGDWVETKALLRPDGDTQPIRRLMHRLERDGLAELKYVPVGPGGKRKKLLIRLKNDWHQRLWL